MQVYNPSDTVVVRRGRSFPARERVTIDPRDEEVAKHLVDAGRLIVIERNNHSADVIQFSEQPKRGRKKRVRDTGSHTGTPTNESEA